MSTQGLNECNNGFSKIEKECDSSTNKRQIVSPLIKNIALFLASTDYIRRQYTGYLSLRNLVIYSRNVENMEIRTTAQTYFLGLLQTMRPTKNRD